MAILGKVGRGSVIPKRYSSVQLRVQSELVENMYRYTRVTSAHMRHKQMDAHSSIKAYTQYKTCQEGMPQDLISAHKELCDTE